MTEGKLQSGGHFYYVKINHFVKDRDFATALTAHFFRNSEPFNDKISKSEAWKILKRGLFFHGLNGEYETTAFEGSFELASAWNDIYSRAILWVHKNYPYLITPPEGN